MPGSFLQRSQVERRLLHHVAVILRRISRSRRPIAQRTVDQKRHVFRAAARSPLNRVLLVDSAADVAAVGGTKSVLAPLAGSALWEHERL